MQEPLEKHSEMNNQDSTENVHTATIEQTLQWITGLYMVFVDFQKAFNSIDREMLCRMVKIRPEYSSPC